MIAVGDPGTTTLEVDGWRAWSSATDWAITALALPSIPYFFSMAPWAAAISARFSSLLSLIGSAARRPAMAWTITATMAKLANAPRVPRTTRGLRRGAMEAGSDMDQFFLRRNGRDFTKWRRWSAARC